MRVSHRSRPARAAIRRAKVKARRSRRRVGAAAAVVAVALVAGAAANKGDAAAVVAALIAAAAADVVNFFFVYYKWDIYTIDEDVGDANAVVRAVKAHWPNLPLSFTHIKLIKKNMGLAAVENHKANLEAKNFHQVIRPALGQLEAINYQKTLIIHGPDPHKQGKLDKQRRKLKKKLRLK